MINTIRSIYPVLFDVILFNVKGLRDRPNVTHIQTMEYVYA